MKAGDIVTALRHQIQDAGFGPTRRLPPERALADRFGVARGTVREALKRLETIGLIERRAGSGTFVAPPAPVPPAPVPPAPVPAAAARSAAPPTGPDGSADAAALPSIMESTRPLELVDVRFGLEPHIVRLAVLQATERDLNRVAGQLDVMARCGSDLDAWADADEAFHRALADCAHNPLIAWMMEQCHRVRHHRQWARMRTLTLTPEIIARYNDQHRAILDGIVDRDWERASRAMRAHLETARRTLLDVTA